MQYIWLLFLPTLIIAISTCFSNKKYIPIKLKGDKKMFSVAQRFVGKRCIINVIGRDCVIGTIQELVDNSLVIEENNKVVAVNLEFVASIEEYPEKNKKINKQ